MVMFTVYKKVKCILNATVNLKEDYYFTLKHFVWQEGGNNGKRIWFENLNYVIGWKISPLLTLHKLGKYWIGMTIQKLFEITYMDNLQTF